MFPAREFPRDRGGRLKDICKACEHAFHDPEQRSARQLAARQAARRRAAEQLGKGYQTREQRQASSIARAQQRELGRLHDAHVRLFRSDDARVYRWRYQFEPAFRDREIARTRRRKAEQLFPKLGDLIRAAVNGGHESPHVQAILGYSVRQFRDHLESHFINGMDWAAFEHGDIHIEHRVRLAAFNLATLAGVRAAWALENLRPAWARDNLTRPVGSRKLPAASGKARHRNRGSHFASDACEANDRETAPDLGASKG